MSVSAPLAAIRAQHPLLHCISNIVSANDCANLALAIGASPIMAQAPQEMADIAALASAVVLNTGKNELFSCEAAGYDNTTSGFSTTVPVLGEPLTPLRRYYGDSRIRTERVLRANYLATINDLPKSVEKTADKTMKVI